MAKFKNIKSKKVYKKAEQKKLPRNYRIIPERLKRDEVVFFICILFMLAATLIVSFDLYSNFREQRRLMDMKIRLISQRVFWENQVKLKPDFRDAYFSLALIDFQLKDYSGAKRNLDKTLELDPNFEKGKELQRELK